MLHLDLDDFKAVNDSLGHTGGDKLLQLVGQRLTRALRETDLVCRLGGDEFLILLSEVRAANDAADAAGKVLAQFVEPFEVDGMEVVSSCSIGIALYPGDGGDFDTLLKNADTAMYSSKDQGRNAFRFFDAEMNAGVIEHVQLAASMRSALARQEFVLHYQPQFDLATGAIIGAEALIRWRHRELGMIPSNRFIPVAERSGLIVDIGAWVLREACLQTARWHSLGLAELERLRRQGVGFSIDDFGTGYSNLGYLKRFEVERLKIDQSFVRRMTVDPHDEAIVRAIIQMSQSLQLKTIAEGVEDEATLKRLIELGCLEGQGFLWSKALPADEFLAFARAHHAARMGGQANA